MGRFVKGDVVVAPFPFSDLSMAKKRPAVVVTALTGDDVSIYYPHLNISRHIRPAIGYTIAQI